MGLTPHLGLCMCCFSYQQHTPGFFFFLPNSYSSLKIIPAATSSRELSLMPRMGRCLLWAPFDQI